MDITTRRFRLWSVCIALSAAVIASWLLSSQGGSPAPIVTAPPDTPSTRGPALTVPSQSPLSKRSPEPRRLPTECQDLTNKPFVPTTVTIEGVGRDRPVIALGLDKAGAPAAPAFSRPNDVSWYNQGPEMLAEAGNALLQAHTFSANEALGNKALEALGKGDFFIVRGAAEQIACYQVLRGPERLASDIDVYGPAVYDFEGPHRLVLTVCSDYDASTDIWQTRTVWFAAPIG